MPHFLPYVYPQYWSVVPVEQYDAKTLLVYCYLFLCYIHLCIYG